MPASSRPDVRLIRYKAGDINLPDDPSYPFRLEICFRLPKFLEGNFRELNGGKEEIIMRGENKEVLNKIVDLLYFRIHPRLRYFIIAGPDGVIEHFSNDN